MTHKATFETTNYPSSSYAQKVAWKCSCGKSGAVTDGRLGASLRRARQSHKRHVAHAEKSAA